MDFELRGKCALVTGASQGIGRGIALALGAEGVKLVIAARRVAELNALADQIAASGAPRPAVVECDLMTEGAPADLAQQAVKQAGRIDIVVNDAGGSRAFKLETDDAQWQEALTLNFTRQRQVAHALIEGMMARREGRIINITGKSEPDGINGAFCAKAAMHSWSKGLSREVGKFGITVNCIAPGRVMSEQILRNYEPEYRQWQCEHEIPVGRYGEPEDIANLACFLASPRAAYITGAVIPVDGGLRRYQF
jgi:3-oxoacyl-[acyl-carrier protein] reductase